MSQRIFVTGASGYLGGAIAARLARAGHQVFGLTRSAEHARGLEAAGVKPVIGDLEERATFIGALQNCDAVVHAAIADDANVALLDQHALEAIREAAVDGRVRRLLYTSGLWVHGDRPGVVTDESSPLAPLDVVHWRAAHEDAALDLADAEVATVIFRGAIVYGEARGIVGDLFREAHQKRTVTYPGDGSQIWSLVHRDDVAEAYALGLEHAAAGERYLLADDQPLAARDVAAAIARVTGAETRAWDADDVRERLGAYGDALLASVRVSAAKARRELGWVPRHTSFAAEADALYREWLAGQGLAVA
ncbi:MAG TPA: NAD-dependent epimerase/dehydratase family protein [Candidatus Saccharimonadaceae bacterium]|jgi:nucleoside-diphosphate-sugar epimerase|nr:NAD-dependent epimerase/dehydratase family protein [Candidatus Saccharimonadaceae bacterium]